MTLNELYNLKEMGKWVLIMRLEARTKLSLEIHQKYLITITLLIMIRFSY